MIGYVCVDGDMEFALRDSAGSQNGALLYFVKYACGSLHCETFHYKSNRIATCVVCSK